MPEIGTEASYIDSTIRLVRGIFLFVGLGLEEEPGSALGLIDEHF